MTRKNTSEINMSLKIILFVILFAWMVEGRNTLGLYIDNQAFINIGWPKDGTNVIYYKYGSHLTSIISSQWTLMPGTGHYILNQLSSDSRLEGIICYTAVIQAQNTQNNFCIYLNKSSTGQLKYGAWILKGLKTPLQRYNEVVNLAQLSPTQVVNYTQTVLVKTTDTTGNYCPEITVRLLWVKPSCNEPLEKLIRPYNCGSQGKCWMWCSNQNTREANSSLNSYGKWCYSSPANTCTTYSDCSSFTSCVDSTCQVNC